VSSPRRGRDEASGDVRTERCPEDRLRHLPYAGPAGPDIYIGRKGAVTMRRVGKKRDYSCSTGMRLVQPMIEKRHT
jgi:hypothetical protein